MTKGSPEPTPVPVKVCRPQTHPRDPFPFRSPKWRRVAYPNDAKTATLEKAHSRSRTGLAAGNGGQDSGRHAQGEHLRRREANVPAPRPVSARTSQARRSPACRASPRAVRGEVSSVSGSPHEVNSRRDKGPMTDLVVCRCRGMLGARAGCCNVGRSGGNATEQGWKELSGILFSRCLFMPCVGRFPKDKSPGPRRGGA